MLSQEDYLQWTEFFRPKISSDGKWSSFQLFSQQVPDTVKVVATDGSKQFSFPDSNEGTFSSTGKWFAFLSNKEGVGLLNFQTGEIRYIANGTAFKFSKDGSILVVTTKKTESSYEGIMVFRLKNEDSFNLKGVSQFKLNSNGKYLLYVLKNGDKNSVNLMDLANWSNTAITEEGQQYTHLLWHDAKEVFFFVENDKTLCYGNTRKPSKIIKQTLEIETFRNMHLGFLAPFFSIDGSRVFFYMQKNMEQRSLKDTLPSVQIWRGDDKYIYPRKIYDGTPEYWQMLSSWNPHKLELKPIGTTEKPKVVLSTNDKYALLYNPLDYEPLYLQYPKVDIYLRNLETEVERLLIKKQQMGIGAIQLAPSGNNISYFDGLDWYNYNIEKDEYTNLTESLGKEFYQKYGDSLKPLGLNMVGWTKGDKGVLVYDDFDIWYISIDGKKNRRLTHGRETQSIYRIPRELLGEFPQTDTPEFRSSQINLSVDIILHVTKAVKSSGYELLKPNGDVVAFAISPSKTSGLQKATNGKGFIFVRETGDTPPQIYFKKGINTAPQLIYQSNPHYKNFKNGKRELITYDAGQWKGLNGILYYPDNYDPHKKYPMVTKIYEILSHKFYDYISPSLYMRDGYNPEHLTAEGYFVFEPDIRYRIGDPAVSAVECVTSAVTKVLERGDIKKDRIGLNGHSYGGYETAFIVGQTDMFSAAVTGAPVTNMLSYYLSINYDVGLPQIWRMENQQWRMGKSYFDDPEGYRRNSPIEYVKNINTPLLIWEGDQDRNIHWFQSVELYLAMRRLKKEGIFYVYPGEAHDLDNPENQKDLSLKITNWFDAYLK